ncbi:MAG TPA: peptide-methionine (S)-S-oxide reductase MsrA, partial [Hyphomicrobiaceae bacterium]|nr:peptide-methionine (S)-S-oxide reductase MsrA [Hyphomicrobiaceae bacterium]
AAATALVLTASAANAQKLETVVLAGGCFWCIESDFDRIPGVVGTVSGYTGGSIESPTYKLVSAGGSGHLEAIEITYDPSQIKLDELLTAFWHSVDPTDAGGQFCDRGDSYATAVFVHDEEERQTAEISKQAAVDELGQAIATPIRDAGTFYPAEDYHQNYYMKNPIRYQFYRYSCGRNQRVKELWGDRAYQGIPDHG